MQELLDIVDLNDKPTGRKTTKNVAHAERLIHRCIAIYLFESDDKVWIQIHKKSGGKYDHSVGGHVAAGEDYLTAAIREAQEELNLPKNLALKHIASSYLSKERSATHMFAIFTARVPKNWHFVPNQEVEKLKLMSLNELVEGIAKKPEEYTGGIINTFSKLQEVSGQQFSVRNLRDNTLL